jgi:hypothetical protein
LQPLAAGFLWGVICVIWRYAYRNTGFAKLHYGPDAENRPVEISWALLWPG